MTELTEHSTKEKKPLNIGVLGIAAFILIVIGGGVAVFAYIAATNKMVYIDLATISAPTVNLSPTTAGTLEDVYVAEGDTLLPNTVVAKVGNELLKSTAGGLVITANNNIGAQVNPGDSVVSMIDPTQLRVVGQVQENKGLTNIAVGDRAVFTVDAFGGEQFTGIVDEVSPTSQSSDVVFSVSNKRQEQNFDVKVRFDTSAYPQLKNGMSAKIWVYKTM